jgi:hypothetical protein
MIDKTVTYEEQQHNLSKEEVEIKRWNDVARMTEAGFGEVTQQMILSA